MRSDSPLNDSVVVPTVKPGEAGEQEESPHFLLVLSRVQIFPQNHMEIRQQLFHQLRLFRDLNADNLVVLIHAGVHHFGIANRGVFRIMRFDKVYARAAGLKGIADPLQRGGSMYDGV